MQGVQGLRQQPILNMDHSLPYWPIRTSRTLLSTHLCLMVLTAHYTLWSMHASMNSTHCFTLVCAQGTLWHNCSVHNMCTTSVYRMCYQYTANQQDSTCKWFCYSQSLYNCWNAQKVDGADTFEWLTFWSSTTGHICKEPRWRNQLDAHWMKAGLS